MTVIEQEKKKFLLNTEVRELTHEIVELRQNDVLKNNEISGLKERVSELTHEISGLMETVS